MHFLRTGAYPAALTGISSEWLPEIPLDIWEQPLQYRPVKGKPVVYGLGPNGVEDEGLASHPRTLDRHTKGDLVSATFVNGCWRRSSQHPAVHG